MDRSHDSRSAADAAARREEIDPWSEFLSESSEELQQLQSARVATPEPGPGAVPVLPPVDATHVEASKPPSSPAPADSSLTDAWPSEPPVTAAVEPEVRPAAPRDGAPPYTRRVSYGRSYESPIPGLAAPPTPAPPPDLALHAASTPAADIPPAAPHSLLSPEPAQPPQPPLIRTASLAEPSSLFAPETPASRSSIWKTQADAATEALPPLVQHPVAPAVPQYDPPPSPARDEAPPVVAREPMPAVVHRHVPSDVPHEAAPSAAGQESIPGRAAAKRRSLAEQGAEHPADSLLLSDILARHTPVHWSEAVATTEELCATIRTGSSDQMLVPDLTDVFITSHGTVGIRQGAAGDPDAAALGRNLHTLLGTGSTPLPLRLFVTSAVSSGRYSSVPVFADALSYYALPDRTQLIQALYRRAMERPAARAVAPRASAVTPPPLVLAARKRGAMTRKTRAIAAAAAIVVAAVSGVWVWSAARGPAEVSLTASVPKVATPPPPKRSEDWAPGPILVEGARPAVPPAQPGPASQAGARADAAASRSARQESAAPRPIPPPASPPAAAVNASPAPARSTAPSVLILPPAPVDTGSPAGASGAIPAAPRSPVVVDTQVYSDADLDVEPPVMLSPVPFVTQNMTVELLITPTGEVRSARLMERPQQLTDGAVLQPAKLWKFRPATKNGQPVSYRYRLRLLAPAN